MLNLSWLGFLAKLLPFSGSLDDIAEAIGELQAAHGSAGYWEAVKKLGDLLQPIVLSVTGFEVASEDHAISAMRLGDGAILKRLREFIESPIGQTLIGLLLGQFGK